MSVKPLMTICDKNGRRYKLIPDLDEKEWIFRIRDKNGVIGHSTCLIEGETLQLMDIDIKESYRRLGLGTALLQHVIQTASGHFKQITGTLGPLDYEYFPNLPYWYEQNGFTVDYAQNPPAIYLSLVSRETT